MGIVIRIQGGLGNQMFQYAFARSLKLSGGVVSMHWHPSRRKSLHTGYSLDSVFKQPLKQHVSLRNDSPFSVLTETFRRKTNRVRQGPNVGFDNDMLSIRSGYIDGYFQSSKYFSEFDDLIRKDFQFQEINDARNNELEDWISGRFVVAIHIRGGDYLNRGANSGEMATVCGSKYYKAAIDLMESKFPQAEFLVFSDDFEYASSIMSDRDFKCVSWNTGEDSWKDMALMSRCDAHIVANSSFSWWGSYLAPSKLRVMPSPWFPAFAKSYNRDIYPPDAIVLEQPE